LGEPLFDKIDNVKRVILILLAGFFFFVFGNWVLSITSPDEGKNLDAALGMLERKDFVVPYYNCRYRFEKPPMFYWLTDLAFVGFGVNEFSERLVSGLAAVGEAILTFLIAIEIFNPETAFIASLVYILFPHNWVEARAAVPEMLLTFFMTLGLYLFIKGRYVLGWLSLAFAFLTKGPVGVILPVGVYLLWKRDLRVLNLKGISLFAVVGSVWYIAMIYKFGFEYFYKFFLYENVMRFTGHKSIHPYPWWYYLPIVALSSVFFLPKLPSVVRGWDKRLNPYLFWFLLVLVFYSVAKNKLHHYVLFLYPPLAVIFARYVGTRYIKVALSVGAVLMLGLFAYAYKLEGERFVPKAVPYIKSFEGEVVFYRTENSAVVFYSRRCISRMERVEDIPQNALVITKEKHLKELGDYRVIVKGNEFGKKLYLVELVR